MTTFLNQEQQSLHARFVSGHNGTTALEVSLVGTPVILSLLTFGLASILLKDRDVCSKTIPRYSRIAEFMLVTLPVLFSLTCCSDPAHYMSLLAVMTLLILALLWRFLSAAQKCTKRSATEEKRSRELVISQPRMLPFVTNYRSCMLLTTAICILAVDFRVFPRRFAKTETFGFGLMDIGVGSFVFASGLVSQEARKTSSSQKRAVVSYLKKNLLESLPMLLLGLLRLASVKGSGYHEHVTEYGVHWNFFFTMAAIKLFSCAFFCVFSTNFSWMASLCVCLTYEGCLSFRLGSWIMATDEDSSRSNQSLLSANREGLCSLPGYFAIYLAGVSWGRDFVEMGDRFIDAWKKAKAVVGWVLAMWLSLFYCQDHFLFLLPSRRLANWGYFNWMVAFNITCLAFFLLSDLLIIYCCELYSRTDPASFGHWKAGKFKGSKVQRNKVEPPPPTPSLPYLRHRVPPSLIAISKNALAYFLLSNVLTGSVNLLLNTLEVSACPAVLTLVAYTLVLHAAALLASDFQIVVKFW